MNQTYSNGQKEVSVLDTQYGEQANVLQTAYEAAVKKLGYSDKELQSDRKAKHVAKEMFSDEILGSKEFNPLLDGDLKGKSDVEKQQAYDNMFSLDLNSFVGSQGIIERNGGLQRTIMANAVDRHYNAKTAGQITAWAWQQAYDPEKSYGENMEAYGELLNQDYALQGGNASVDVGKFNGIDDIAQALATSLMGRQTVENFKNRNEVEFN